MAAPIQIAGLRELQQTARRSADREVPKRLGEANREIGQLVIRRLEPRPTAMAVGSGAGSTVRPSAAKREVLLRVGGNHRSSGVHTNKQPWGRRRVVPPGTSTPDRPFIQGTAQRHEKEIVAAYERAISDAMRGAFHRT